ncbi:MAG: NADH-quinone oxidoreductase subunit J [Mariprofundales bacterium]|nr:NADH-quinone oxidoreductase subunit J [Mariprofundales bacterium]
MLESIFFYLFGGLATIGALLVVLSRNPMHSVMWLIFCFFNAAGLFFLLDAEFIGIITILIYVGAVMVLFIFVIIMLEVNVARMREGFLHHLPLGGMIAMLVFIEMASAGFSGVFSAEQMGTAVHLGQEVNNTAEIGKELYTHYLLGFELAAIILLAALVGSVVLTIRSRKDAKYQNIPAQIAVKKSDRLRKVRM